MAPIVIPTDFALLHVKSTNGAGGHCRNIYGVHLNLVPAQSQLDALSTALATAYKPVITTTGRYDGLEIFIGLGSGDPLFMQTVTGAAGGTLSGVLSSPQVQFLVKKTTAMAGRHNHGRTFLCDVPESDVDQSGVVTAGAVTRLNTFGGNVLNALNTIAPFTGMHIRHVDDSRSWTPVTNFFGSNMVATLRARYQR